MAPSLTKSATSNVAVPEAPATPSKRITRASVAAAASATPTKSTPKKSSAKAAGSSTPTSTRKTAASTTTASPGTPNKAPATKKSGGVASDARYPLFLGFWKKSVPYVDDLFAEDDLDEPHIKRKITILEKHPEIEKLYGYEPKTRLIAYLCVAIQLSLAFLFGRVWTTNTSWLVFFAVTWFVGASLTQLIGIILHEATHCLVAEDPTANKILAIFANIAIPFPIAMSFRRYHLDHHAYQGVYGKDPDLPLDIEYRLVRGNSLLKFIWLFFYPVMYVVRGASFGRDISFWEAVNICTTLIGDVAIYWVCGWKGLFYLFCSLWLGYGIHPAAAHFIQEHYTFEDGQETYSYYGSFNKIFMNIGYHNEHHDFQKVAWTNLPAVRSIATEFYDTIASHQSWWGVLWKFVTQKTYGPQSRVARPVEAHKEGRRMIRLK